MNKSKFIIVTSLVSIALVASISHIVLAVDVYTPVNQPKRGVIDNIVSGIIAITAVSYVTSLYIQSRKQPNCGKNRG